MQSANLSGPFRGCLYYALLGLPQATGLAGGYDLRLEGVQIRFPHGCEKLKTYAFFACRFICWKNRTVSTTATTMAMASAAGPA